MSLSRSPAGPPTGAPSRPRMPALVLRATAGAFFVLSRLRLGRRSLHPSGEAYEGVVELRPPAGIRGHGLFGRRATYRATVRFSRGIGLPHPLPDLLGIAVRLHDARGSGRHQDLLVSSSAGPPVLRRMLIPARDGYFGQWFSSVLPYRIGGRRTVFGVRALTGPAGDGTDFERLAATARRGDLTFALAMAQGPFARWRRVGLLHVGERLADEAAERLRFAAWTTGDDVRPVGLLNALRAAAYPGSQRGRARRRRGRRSAAR